MNEYGVFIDTVGNTLFTRYTVSCIPVYIMQTIFNTAQIYGNARELRDL